MTGPPIRRIESTANSAVRQWRALHKRRGRREHESCIVEGAREVSRALGAGVEFEAVILGDEAAPSERELATAVAVGGAAQFELGDAALAKVSVRRHPAGIIGIARSPGFGLSSLALPDDAALVLVAAGVEKPGNLGAMIRSADGAATDAVIAANATGDLMNPNVIRASQGAVFTVPVAAASAAETKTWLASRRVALVAATAGAPVPYWDHDLTGPTAIVIGSEHAGLPPEWRDVPSIAIPMHGTSDSLNASVAAALLLYEARRQRS